MSVVGARYGFIYPGLVLVIWATLLLIGTPALNKIPFVLCVIFIVGHLFAETYLISVAKIMEKLSKI